MCNQETVAVWIERFLQLYSRTTHRVLPALLVQHIIIKHHTCNLRVNTKPAVNHKTVSESAMAQCPDHFRKLYGQICTSRSPAVFSFFPPGSHFLDHLSTAA